MLSYGAKLVRDERVAGSDLLAFVIYQLTLGSILSVRSIDQSCDIASNRHHLLSSLFKDISQIYTSLMTAAGASQSVFDYLDRKPVQRPNGTLQPKEFQGDIEFNNVSLVYPARPNEVAIQVLT